ncbi:MAG: multidrug DMT transporter permease [Salinibacterium sp.]|nr:MAG: multidrug DMT transporter permease [Salinibacterium sp.]
MPPDLSDLTDQISLTPDQAWGIPVAIVAAMFLSLGAQYQHRGVGVVEEHLGNGEKAGLSIRQLRALMTRPSWVVGTLLLGLAIVLQLTSLGLSPITVVQPLGAVALVMTAIMNSRTSKVPLDRVSIRAIILCVTGVGIFVTVAAMVTKSNPITTTQLSIVLAILAVVLTVFAVLFALLRKRIKPIFYIVGAGFLFGFVATLAKVIIDRVKTIVIVEFHIRDVEWLLVLCFVGLILAALLGTYFVQTAYASGPPDLVVAGLTVIDPLVAVSIGIVVLGEAANAPGWAVIAWIIAGAMAIFGVLSLSRHHADTTERASVS